MASLEKKLKHLDFIQLTITRMAANSFLLKAWSVTLVAALFALSAKDADERYVLIAYVPVLAFWILDAYYLHQERLYRALYDSVRNKSEADIDFSLSTAGFADKITSWPGTVLSKSLSIFYGTVLVLLLIVTFVIN